jgi:hypothetical protein
MTVEVKQEDIDNAEFRPSKTHELKVWPEFYGPVSTKMKQFEVRENDRDFHTGDTLILLEWDPDAKKYTGNRADASVDYILKGGQFGIEPGMVVMSITVTGTRKVYK